MIWTVANCICWLSIHCIKQRCCKYLVNWSVQDYNYKYCSNEYLGFEYKSKYEYFRFLPSTFRVLFGLEFLLSAIMSTGNVGYFWQQQNIIRYDTIAEFNMDSKAEYTDLSSTRSQKKKLKQNNASVPLIQYRLRSVKAVWKEWVTMEERICERGKF